jgi:hypothetical protein
MTEEVEQEVKRGPGRPRREPEVMPVAYTEKPRKFPIKLLRGYFPIDPEHPRNPRTGDSEKVNRGEVAVLDYAEAKQLIEAGIAERADALP